MFGWLFSKKPEVLPPGKETMFSRLPLGQEFHKVSTWDSETYIKTSDKDYETIENGHRCIKWYHVHEDFTVQV